MDVRLTGEQQQLRNAAAKLADDLGPSSVAELADAARIERLDRQLAGTGWCALRSDGASGVEVAIVAEEFGRGLVDAPFRPGARRRGLPAGRPGSRHAA